MNKLDYRLQDVIALLRLADMSSSYKPALLAALVNQTAGRQLQGGQITLDALAGEYLRMYWSQVVVYRLRHSARDTAPPVIVQLILAASDEFGARHLGGLPEAGRASLIGLIAKVLPINVLSAFHASKPQPMPNLYQWQKGFQHVIVPPEAAAFIRSNSSALTLIANYYWARFLSRLNAAPYIVDKLERPSPRRSSLAKFARHLADIGESACFYCGKRDLAASDRHLDHFIPWTFVFEDRLWNLVIACQVCNTKKSDGLAPEYALQRLVNLNRIRESSPSHKAASMLSLSGAEDKLARLYDLAREEQWPMWQDGGAANGGP